LPQGSVLGPLLFLVYVNDIWRNIDTCIRLFTDGCIIYRKITNRNDIEELQKDLDTLGNWAVENGIKINPGNSKTIRFTRAGVKNPLGYSLDNQKIPEPSSCKYLGIILRSDLNWVDQVNYTAQKDWEELHYVMCVLKKGNINKKRLAYMALVRSILEYGSACWDPCREGWINALDRVQEKAVQFINHTKDSDWKILAQLRTIARLCVLFKAYCGERDRLRRPYYLSRVDHIRKIRDRKQRMDIGKFSFVNKAIKHWN
jgi:hypothetical protein